MHDDGPQIHIVFIVVTSQCMSIQQHLYVVLISLPIFFKILLLQSKVCRNKSF